jgi:outer membrane immunogenic protein
MKAMPVKAPAGFVAAPPTWAGWYAGIAGGGGWGSAEQSDSSPFNSGRFDIDGAIVGGTIGYNWQSGAMVFGLESDLSYAAIKGSTTGTDPFFGPCGGAYCATDIKALGTVRARFGLTWNNLLPYVTGGLAYANVHGDEGNGGPAAFGSGSSWMAGWTLGAGLEAKFAPNWSAKVEYLYAQMSGDVFTANVFGVPYSQNNDITAQVVRVGINYHF